MEEGVRMSGVIGIRRVQKGGENGAGWRGAGGHAYAKERWVRPLQFWATSETESSVTLVPLSGGGVVGGCGGRWGGGERERAAVGGAYQDEGRPRKERMGRAGVARVAMRTPSRGR